MTIDFTHQSIVKMQLKDEWATARLAKDVALWLNAALQETPNFVIELEGDLGAGKTTFTRYLLQALGVAGRVKSPTYAIVETYEVQGLSNHIAISHFDFYRFKDESEWEEAGFRDIFSSTGLKIVEWADKARGLLPSPQLRITLVTTSETEREITLHYLAGDGI